MYVSGTAKPAVKRLAGSNVAVVMSSWHRHLGEGAYQGALSVLRQAEVKHELFVVPGAYELPLAASHLLATKRFAGVIALGVVIRGDTPHFDYVCDSVVQGLMRVQLDTGIPVGFGLITTHTEAQAEARTEPVESQPKIGNKGEEAALAVVDMIHLIRQVGEQRG